MGRQSYHACGSWLLINIDVGLILGFSRHVLKVGSCGATEASGHLHLFPEWSGCLGWGV